VFTLERVLTEQGHMGAFQVAIDNSTSWSGLQWI
jgi:hypothetical protein